MGLLNLSAAFADQAEPLQHGIRTSFKSQWDEDTEDADNGVMERGKEMER
jgi:hypothetical protein